MGVFSQFLNNDNFMPHGHCFLWQSDIFWMHLLSDGATATAYFAIPLVLVYILRKREDLPFENIFILFAAFILFCGVTHVSSIWVLWHPDYAIQGVLKAATALVSVATLGVLIYLVPRILAIPSPAHLVALNQKLQESNQELERLHQQSKVQSDSYLNAVVNTVLDGLITIDGKGVIHSFNPAAERIFGYSIDEVLGQNVKMLMPDPYHAEHDGYLRHYQSTGEKKVIGIGREVSGKRKDGSVFAMELGVNEMQAGGERMFVGTVRDISARKAAEIESNDLMRRLLESNTELERFAYIASHDMQEPIRMVTNFSEIIAKDYSDLLDEPGRGYLTLVVNSGVRMRNLVEDLLSYSRMGSESQQMVPFDGEVVLEGVLENLRELIKGRRAEINHGRGIALSRMMSFDHMEYIGNGNEVICKVRQ